MIQMRAMSWAFILAVLSAVGVGLRPAQAADTNGFEWCDITAPGNAAYPGNQFGLNAGRGSVGYTYRMAKHEVTTGQWLEFYNTFSTQSDELENRLLGGTGLWATFPDPTYPITGPGRRMVLNSNIPNADRVSVKGISWRLAALYCNWLHHDKPSDWNTIQSGAYDARTFGQRPDGTITDQLTRSPDARFWIPSLDEWMKAVYFDPKKGGVGGWWNQPNGSDIGLTPGFPGVGQTSAGLGPDATWIPVGSYPEVRTPWGLLDASGGVSEWTEEIDSLGFDRLAGGTSTKDGPMRFDEPGFQLPWAVTSSAGPGLRIASSIPNSGVISAVLCGIASQTLSRKRRQAGGPITP